MFLQHLKRRFSRVAYSMRGREVGRFDRSESRRLYDLDLALLDEVVKSNYNRQWKK